MVHIQGAKPTLSRSPKPARPAHIPTDRGMTTYPLPTYIRLAQLVSDVVPVSKATIWRWVKSGDFPAPIKLAESTTAWKLSDVLDWLQTRAPA